MRFPSLVVCKLPNETSFRRTRMRLPPHDRKIADTGAANPASFFHGRFCPLPRNLRNASSDSGLLQTRRLAERDCFGPTLQRGPTPVRASQCLRTLLPTACETPAVPFMHVKRIRGWSTNAGINARSGVDVSSAAAGAKPCCRRRETSRVRQMLDVLEITDDVKRSDGLFSFWQSSMMYCRPSVANCTAAD